MSRPSSAIPIEINPPGDLTYQWQEDVEDLEGYHVGGYHPVHLQDEYSGGRYRIVHKLGFGTYSTVWLAKDQHMDRYVALKIVVAEASKTSQEGQIVQRLSLASTERSYVCSIFDEFYLDGPNGRHLCLVGEPARCSIADSKEASRNWMFPMIIARAVAAQVILGLQEIHSCDIVHGDLHIKNILFRLPHIHSLSVNDIYQCFGEPQKTKVERMDGAPAGSEAPSYSVMPMQSVIASEKISDPRIVISDFGEAWLSNTQTRENLNTPVLYLPPETTFSKDIKASADVWTLGCTLYEILAKRPLFEGFMPDRDDIIAEMVSCLGILPQQWWESWQARGEFFLEDGSWKMDMKRFHDSKSRPLLLRIHQMGRKDDTEFLTDEATSLEKMLRAMLVYDPDKRATAKDITNSDWMKRWGLPALEKFM